MSTVEDAPLIDHDPDEDTAASVDQGSLAKRMQARRAAIEAEQTDLFPLASYGGIVSVELRVVGFKRERAIYEHHRKKTRDPTLRDLYAAADVLLQATVGFYAVIDDEGANRPVSGEQNSWQGLARSANPHLSDLTPRQALLALVGDDQLMRFYGEYETWRSSRGEDTDKELDADLGKTR